MRSDKGAGARPALTIDLGGVRALTAADLGRLVGLHRLLKVIGARLVLINVGETAHEILKLTCLTRIFAVRPAADAAKKAA